MVRAWRIGGRREAAWIDAATSVGTRITAGIPPVFVRYATVVIPDDDAARTRSDTALVGVLSAHTLGQPWWFGYLETGGADVICADAARVSVYAGWPYVLLEADAEQALTWRSNADATLWHSALPELLFPADRSWLVSTLWDDDWRCVGGSAPCGCQVTSPTSAAMPCWPRLRSSAWWVWSRSAEAAVDGLGRAVGCPVGEVGQDVVAAAVQRARAFLEPGR